MAKPWDKVKRKRGRKVRRLRSLHRYLIVCEDEKSSRLYLQSFPYDRNLIEVKPHGGCGETLSVVETGIAMKEQAKKNNSQMRSRGR